MKAPHFSLREPIKVLKEFQKIGFKTAILAGGAIRDENLNQSIKDYDIFIWDPTFSHEASPEFVEDFYTNVALPEALFTSLFKKANVPFSSIETAFFGSYSCVDDNENFVLSKEKIFAVWNVKLGLQTEYEHIDEIPYQIIVTKEKPIIHVNKYFDIGLCKAYCDGKKIHYTADYLKDKRNKTLTIVGRNMTFDEYKYTVEEHIPRIQKKYPNYHVEIASHNVEHTRNIFFA